MFAGSEESCTFASVFHGIRFKVNKRLGQGVDPFFMSLCEIEGRRMMDFASEYGYSSSEHSFWDVCIGWCLYAVNFCR